MIRFGTSGFSYDDWVGEVYPQDMPKWQWLAYYATQFDTVELNVSYYRIPSEKVARGWVERTPDGFLFTVKAHRSITHERAEPEYKSLLKVVEPLREAGKLACVLAQFPYSFHPTPKNREYLLSLREGFRDHQVVIEFRDSQWVAEDTFELLEELNFGFCCVDEPRLKGLMPPIARVTGPIAYLRLHGRNAEKWWRHQHAWERYDYDYQRDELLEWVPKIRDMEKQSPLTLVYANNHYKGKSVNTLRALSELLAADI